MKSSVLRKLPISLCLLTLILGAAGCSLISGSGCSASDGEKIGQLYNEFHDAYKLALSSSRITLGGPISTMQGVKQKLFAMKWPQCARETLQAMLDWFNSTINAFLYFMQSSNYFSEQATSQKLADAEQERITFIKLAATTYDSAHWCQFAKDNVSDPERPGVRCRRFFP